MNGTTGPGEPSRPTPPRREGRHGPGVLRAALALALLAGGAGPGPDGDPAAFSLRFQGDPESSFFGSVEVTGLPPSALASLEQAGLDEAGWLRILSVHTGPGAPDDGTHPPVIGDWSAGDGVLRFTPRFIPATGLEYTARFDGAAFDAMAGVRGALTPGLRLVFSMPEPEASATTVVESVSPGPGEVPENLLRLYIHFSAPMKRQVVQGAVHLFHRDGSEVELPFVEVPEGLWDPSRTRLTLIFHPGRIKRGVGPNLAMGPPMKEGGIYRLVIDASLRDADGFSLARPHEVIWRAGPADRTSPDVAAWRVEPPGEPGEPVTLILDEPLDRALLRRLIAPVDSGGTPVAGSVAVADGGRRWRFTPARPWAPGAYALEIDPAIEDLAGNTPLRLFDVATGAGAPGPGGPSGEGAPLRLEFTIGR